MSQSAAPQLACKCRWEPKADNGPSKIFRDTFDQNKSTSEVMRNKALHKGARRHPSYIVEAALGTLVMDLFNFSAVLQAIRLATDSIWFELCKSFCVEQRL